MMESGQTGFPTLDLSKVEQVQEMLDGNRQVKQMILLDTGTMVQIDLMLRL